MMDRPQASSAPEVSVVIPCYNTHAFLRQTIDSVRGQTCQPLEIIVVNDGSTDPATLAVLDALGGDVRVIHQQNKGLPAARNAGFAAARGRFVLPLDADDWIEPTAVQQLTDALHRNPEAAFAFAQLVMEGDGKGVLRKNYNHFEQLFLNQLPYSLMLRREVWQAVGGYDESMRRGYEDWEFNIRLGIGDHGGIVVAEPLFHYRISQGGMLLATSNRIHGELWEAIRRKHASVYRLGELWRLWRFWRHRPSTYPLGLYFAWWLAAVMLPRPAFAALFKALRKYSQGRRITAANTRA